MLAALGTLIPLAIALSISTVPFLATVVILLSPRRGRSIPYLIGYVVGLLLVVGAFSFGLAVVPRRIKLGPEFAVVEIVVGLALIALAIVQWRRRGSREPSSGAWLGRLERVGPLPALGFALALNLRPKSLLVCAAAGLALSRAQLEFGDMLICIAVFTVLGSITVSVPTIMSLVMPRRTSAWLLRARSYLVRNSRLLTVIVLFMIGVVIAGYGLTRL